MRPALRCSLLLASSILVWAGAGPGSLDGRAAAEDGACGRAAAQDVWLDDRPGGIPIPIAAEPAAVERAAPARFALPAGHALDGREASTGEVRATGVVEPVRDRPGSPTALEPIEEWHVDNARPALRVNLAPGATHGFANRFDPADLADRGDGPPRPLVVRKIHFLVNASGEPTGPMEWHLWEDNGGHKADAERDIVSPFTVTGRPGENVIDLEAMGVDVRIDPPRQFHVGAARKVSETGSPDVLLDDGLPFVGGSGDFHASASGTAIRASSSTMYCGTQEWVLLSVSVDDAARSPAWMVWLEVEWLDAPDSLLFEAAAGPGSPAGDFASASRVAWGDYDNDGLEDLIASGSHLYRNLGDGTFGNVTATAGITDTGGGALWGDYDNDGDLDFFQYTSNCVPCRSPSPDNYDDLWRNNGDGTFTNVRAADHGGAIDAPVPRDPLPTEAAAWGDFNGDGYLDLYTANHVDWDTGDCFDDYLWLNEGPPAYGFRDVSEASGIRAARLCGRGVSPSDFDGDGDADIFVANYRLKPDLLWVNQGNDADGVPHFVNEARQRGVEGVLKTGSFAGQYGHSIGAVWGDLDVDGDRDLVVANLAHSAWRCFSDATMVYLSSGWEGEYGFTDVRERSGVAYVETHSDPSLADVDNDGWLDLLLTHVYDGWRSSLYRNTTGDEVPPARTPVAYLPGLLKRSELAAGPGPSTAGGLGASRLMGAAVATDDEVAGVAFGDVTHLSGIYPRTAWGSGWSDFDNDGDLDLAAQGLWRNNAADGEEGNRWLQVAAVGCGRSNRDAIGARVGVTVIDDGDGAERQLWSEVTGARGTGSQDTRLRHFGLGADGSVSEVRVIFPSGAVRTLSDVGHDRRITVTEVGAYIRPSAWSVVVGDELTLYADTCGEERSVAWDLDEDGEYDDGEGDQVRWAPSASGAVTLAARVSDGTIRSVNRVTVLVMPQARY